MNEPGQAGGHLPGSQRGHDPAVAPPAAAIPQTPRREDHSAARRPRRSGEQTDTPGVEVDDAGRAAMQAGERLFALAAANRYLVAARDIVTELQEEIARAVRTMKDLEWSDGRLQAGSVWPDRVTVDEQLDELARRCERSSAPDLAESLRRARGALDAAGVLNRPTGLPDSPPAPGDRQEMLTRIQAVREQIDRVEPVLDQTGERLHHTAVLARYAQEHRRDGAGPVEALGRILGDVVVDGASLERSVTDLSTRSADAAAYADILARAGQPRSDQARDVAAPSSGSPAPARGVPR